MASDLLPSPHGTGPEISFVIPVRNDAVRLARCLATIAASVGTGTRIECVVADNGSIDGSAEVARSAGAVVLSMPGVNVSTLRNQAASIARAPVLAFVDADHELGRGWTPAALDVFRDDGVGAAGAAYSAPPDGTWTQRLFGALRGRTRGRHDTEWLGSGNLAVRRSVFAAIRGFDESLQTCEDVDLCQRLRRAGWRLVADEHLESVHMGDPRTLWDLFRSERWRGRDNLRLSVRSVPTLGDLPSIIIPVVDACAFVAGACGVLVVPFRGWALPVVAACVAIVLGFAALRALRILARGGFRGPIDIAGALAVALAYDAGRAVSLIWPARHRRSRPEPPGLAVTKGV